MKLVHASIPALLVGVEALSRRGAERESVELPFAQEALSIPLPTGSWKRPAWCSEEARAEGASPMTRAFLSQFATTIA